MSCRSILFLCVTMPTRLLLLLCLTGHVFARELPDVDCLVMHIKYVHCSWNKQGTPEVNYTFYGWFQAEKRTECPTYLSENNINIGCNLPYKEGQRFTTFETKLVHGNQTSQREHKLKTKVKLNPPTNVTVKNGSNSNLWLNWTQVKSNCVESEVRYRVNNKKWETQLVSIGVQKYCVNLPSSSSLYELQVRSRIGDNCGMSTFWSDWSEPVFWGFGGNNSTDPNQMNSSMSVWTPVLYVVGAFVLILLVTLLLHHERIGIIFIPVVPKPSPNLHNVEDWFQYPKGLKESFSYNERPCLVREYCHVSQSESEDCSVSSPVNESDLSTSCSCSSSSSSSSTSTSTVSTEEEMVSV